MNCLLERLLYFGTRLSSDDEPKVSSGHRALIGLARFGAGKPPLKFRFYRADRSDRKPRSQRSQAARDSAVPAERPIQPPGLSCRVRGSSRLRRGP